MTDDGPEPPESLVAALEDHGAFERGATGFDCTTTPFDVTVTGDPAPEGREATVYVTVVVPTLDAAVPGESVAEIVELDWFETFDRRVSDVGTVLESADVSEPSVEREGEHVVFDLAFRAWTADVAVADAKAAVDFVEGTYVQGVIPGYDYGEPVSGLLARARSHGERAARGN